MLGLASGLVLLLALLALLVHVALVLRWQARITRGDAYFALPVAERRALKERMRRRGRLALPLLELAAPLLRGRRLSMRYRGFTAPALNCSPETFDFAVHYRPRPEDVFVATQMKCGTTWMQQIVYETVCRGKGNLGDDGHRHLYAMSPWIESHASVALPAAPIVGERPTRIVKTHLPAALCPFDPAARYVYVLRHPVSCFVSCVEFIAAGGGAMAPSREWLLDWFCGEEMWWGPWPDHAEGWWRWQQERPNVLFLHYEEMRKDLGATVSRVAGFLGVELSETEHATVVEKSGFQWMKDREEWFEMHPPNIFSEGGRFFPSGSLERHADATPAEAERIRRFCRERLAGGRYPLARFYPDVASGTT
jgi:aryl sulfotransferase